jgi:hypothetical protein
MANIDNELAKYHTSLAIIERNFEENILKDIEQIEKEIKEKGAKEDKLFEQRRSSVRKNEREQYNSEIRKSVDSITKLFNKLDSMKEDLKMFKANPSKYIEEEILPILRYNARGGRRIKKSKRTHKRKHRASKTRKH